MIFGYFAIGDLVLNLMVQRTYGVMTNDVLISIPLFVFMGYIIERAAIIDRLFYSVQLAAGRLPAALAVATVATCALFSTATGIIGAVVTLMGLLAFPAMLRHGYDIKLSAGAITAGGCLGILIPPSILLILYGATAGVSVVRLYAGAFLPGVLLAGLYLIYVMTRGMLNPRLAPRLPPEATRVPMGTVVVKLLQSFFPLTILIMGVLGSIVFGLATPSEAAAIGALGGVILAIAYRAFTIERLKESVFLTARTTAMVCWLFVGSALFSAVFALLGGAAAHRGVGAVAQPEPDAVPSALAGDHLCAGLAAGVDRDHRNLHADLPAAHRTLRYRSAVLRAARRPEFTDRVPLAAGGDVRVLPEGRGAPARNAEPDLRRDDALHGDSDLCHGAALYLAADRPVAAVAAL
jgi:tripartite ATP-independent transporter DctM subunit